MVPILCLNMRWACIIERISYDADAQILMTLYYIMTVFVKLRTKERKETIHKKKMFLYITEKRR